MDLKSYNATLIPKGQGLNNFGNSCYFNSILQCILSCPSIFEVLEENADSEKVKHNPFLQALMDLHKSAMKGESIADKNRLIWQFVYHHAIKRKDRTHMQTGAQEDAHETLMMFLDMFDSYMPIVSHLFQHRHRTQVVCDVCGNAPVDKRETNNVFEVQPTLTNEVHANFADWENSTRNLNDFLLKQKSSVEDYKCTAEVNGGICGSTDPKMKVTSLTMVPEILPIALKKYTRKIPTPFPAQLKFVSSSGKKKIIYKLVAQSEHSGGMSGGHYWAVCKRSDGWMNLNDNSVSPGTPGPTLNTYLLFYHYSHIEDNDV